MGVPLLDYPDPFPLPAGQLAYDGMEAVLAAFRAGLQPDPDLTVTEWSDANRYLSAEASAAPDKYRSSRTPYLIEPMDNLSPSSSVVQTTELKGAQIGASESALNAVGFHMDASPCSILYVLPDRATAGEFSKQRIDPMIDACPSLRAKVPAPGKRGGGNTKLSKRFKGGVFRFGWAGSAASLDSSPMRFLVLDEVDKYPVDVCGEGSPLDKADARSRTFGFRRKKVVLSTPGLKATSVVYAEYLRGDQRHWCMPCPHCAWGEAGSRFEGKGTVYHPDLFRWTPGKPRSAHMECRNCGKAIWEDQHKSAMLAEGVWIPTAKNQDEHEHRSYYMPSYLSPIGWLSWPQIASMKDRAAGNYARSKTVCNSVDGMPWEDAGQAPDWEFVMGRRSKGYRRRQLPPGVLFLTCGGDVGIDHVELHVWGWGRDNKRWLIDVVRISGRTTEASTWDLVADVLKRKYVHPYGAVLPIRRTGIDRGHLPEVVDAFVQTQDQNRVCAVRGRWTLDGYASWTTRREANRAGTFDPKSAFLYLLVGTTMIKGELFGALNLEQRDGGDPIGWVALPDDVSAEFCRQLVSERMVYRAGRDGRLKGVYVGIESRRHEALDCAVYARALAYDEGWDDWGDAEFRREEAALEAAAAELAKETARRQLDRLRAGDRTPVGIEDIHAFLARPVEPIQIAPEEADMPQEEPDPIEDGEGGGGPAADEVIVPGPDRGPTAPRVRNPAPWAGRGAAVTDAPQPGEVGSAHRVDFRALMRRSGMSRSASRDD